jgi:hypothetical protein
MVFSVRTSPHLEHGCAVQTLHDRVNVAFDRCIELNQPTLVRLHHLQRVQNAEASVVNTRV